MAAGTRFLAVHMSWPRGTMIFDSFVYGEPLDCRSPVRLWFTVIYERASAIVDIMHAWLYLYSRVQSVLSFAFYRSSGTGDGSSSHIYSFTQL